MKAAFTSLFDGSRPDEAAVARRRGETVGLRRFRREVAAAAASFAGQRRVALVCQDRYAFAVGLFGLLQAGAELVIPSNRQPGTLDRIGDQFDRLCGDDEIHGLTPQGAEPGPVDPAALSLNFFTSGSTGIPKRVAKSLGMIAREVATLEAMWGRNFGDAPVFSMVSHQHFYGFIFSLMWPLAAGRPFVAETHEDWESLLRRVPGGAVLISSPAHLSRIAGVEPLSPEAQPRAIFSAGAPLPEAAGRESRAALGHLPIEIFGSTENGATATRQGDGAWNLLPGTRIRVDDEGRMALLSPYSERGDWTQTADLVEPAPGGFRFLGRADGVVKIEGKRIGLASVEAALTELPWVDAAWVAVLAGAKPRLAAAIVPSAEGRAMLERLGGFRFGRLLRRSLADTHEPAGMPRRWRFVERLPEQHLGKRRLADFAALFQKHYETA